jgi:hypothetical protein
LLCPIEESLHFLSKLSFPNFLKPYLPSKCTVFLYANSNGFQTKIF